MTNFPNIDINWLKVNYKHKVHRKIAFRFAAGHSNLKVVKKLMKLHTNIQFTTDHGTVLSYAY